ncbi:MAG: NINE protein, partial [Nannocystaceae bacterium]
MRDLGTAYLLCLAQFFGFAGLHRYYLGKPVTGTLWLFTWGLFGIGLLYDLITLPAQVEAINRRLLASGYRPYGYLPASQVYIQQGSPQGYAGQPGQPYQPGGYPQYGQGPQYGQAPPQYGQAPPQYGQAPPQYGQAQYGAPQYGQAPPSPQQPAP